MSINKKVNLSSQVGLFLIHLYQKYLSPIKGYSCAYAFHTGSYSCSAFGVKAIEKKGLFIGSKLINRRFKKCAKSAKKAEIYTGWRNGNVACLAPLLCTGAVAGCAG